MKICWVFAGQGSQYLGMGKALYDSHPVFKSVMDEGFTEIATQTSKDLLATLYQNQASNTVFNELILTHPALVLIQVALAKTLLSEAFYFDSLWGNSIGELAVAVLADVLSLKEALTISINQAKLVQDYVPKGGLVAIMDQPEQYLAIPELAACDWAGQSFSGHFTLAALTQPLKTALLALKVKRIFHQQIHLDYPFHSSYLEAAKSPFLKSIESIPFKPSQVTCYSSALAGKVLDFTAEHCWEAVSKPLAFQDCFEKLQASTEIFIDCSPSASMATLMKYNPQQEGRRFYASLSPFKKDLQWLKDLQALYKSI